MTNHNRVLRSISLLALLCGCVSDPVRKRESQDSRPSDPILERQFVLDVLRHVYRWHFDQSYVLESEGLKTFEIWGRRIKPSLDPGDRSEFAELWIPVIKTRIDLKLSNYAIPEMNLDVVDSSFKVSRVVREVRPPASRSHYSVATLNLQDVRDYLFTTRSDRVHASQELRTAARNLIVEYLNRVHPTPFTEDQVVYIASLSSVSNDLWVFWETGRKVLLFSADTDLSKPGFSQLSQLRLEVIDLDQDIVASTREVPGSNVFVTKDWVGRLFFNCILYGERVVRTPEELSRMRSDPALAPTG